MEENISGTNCLYILVRKLGGGTCCDVFEAAMHGNGTELQVWILHTFGPLFGFTRIK